MPNREEEEVEKGWNLHGGGLKFRVDLGAIIAVLVEERLGSHQGTAPLSSMVVLVHCAPIECPFVTR